MSRGQAESVCQSIEMRPIFNYQWLNKLLHTESECPCTASGPLPTLARRHSFSLSPLLISHVGTMLSIHNNNKKLTQTSLAQLLRLSTEESQVEEVRRVRSALMLIAALSS